MVRNAGEKNYFNFSAGLITEGIPLGAVENSARDVDNFIIDQTTGLRRRRGFDFEPDNRFLGSNEYAGGDYVPNPPQGEGFLPSSFLFRGSFVWRSAGGTAGRDYFFVCVGEKVLVYALTKEPYSANLAGYINYGSTDGTDLSPVSFAAYGSWLVMADGTGQRKPVAVNVSQTSLDQNGGLIAAQEISPKIRDFGVLTPKILPGTRVGTFAINSPTVTPETTLIPGYEAEGYTFGHRLYDLYNAGWGYDTIASFQGYLGAVLPSVGDPPQAGIGVNKNGGPAWHPSTYKLNFAGGVSGFAQRGRFVLDVYNPDRRAALDATGANRTGTAGYVWPITVPNPAADQITCTGAYAGRIWYGGRSNKIYYSSQVRDFDRADLLGACYQDQDPTAHEFSALLATDGGYISVSGGGDWRALVPFGNSILAMNSTGVWEITGADGGMMNAESIVIRKLTESGLLSPHSVVSAEGTLLYMGEGGIYGAQRDAAMGTITVTNVSDETIFTWLSSIPQLSLEFARGVYDYPNKRVYWVLNKDQESRSEYWAYAADTVLALDMRTGAFFKFSIAGPSGPGTHALIAPLVPPRATALVTDEPVYVLDDTVLVGDETVLVPSGVTIQSTEARLYGLTVSPSAGIDASAWRMSFGAFYSNTLRDWPREDGGYPYTSYVEVSYDTFDDPKRIKDIHSLYFWFRITEGETEYFEAEDGVVESRWRYPSAANLTIKWDWSIDISSGRWYNAGQIYRLPEEYILPSDGSPVNIPYDTTTSHVTVSGQGRSVTYRIESSPDHELDLLGWAVIATAGDIP